MKNETASKQSVLETARGLPFLRLIGLEVLDVAPGWSRAQLSWRDDLTQPAGVMHGGVLASLIDTGLAHALMLDDEVLAVRERGGGIVSVDLRVKYFRPVTFGVVACESRIVRRGRQIVHLDSVATNESGKEVARGDAIYLVVEAEQLRAR